MPMTSIFWDTSGVGDGAVAYTEDQLQEWLRKVILFDPATEGVLTGVGGAFAVTGTASPLTAATGACYVYGTPAWDNAPTSITVATPVINTTGHRVVLRANWAAQTVRIVLKSSADGVSAIPALTQTALTTWEVSLATLLITTGGVITVTDTRAFCHFNTRVSSAMLDPSAVTTASIGNLQVTTAKLADASVSTVKMVAGSVTTGILAEQNVVTSKLADGAVTAGKVAAGVAVANLGFTPWGPSNDGDGSGLDADLVAGVDIAPLRIQSGASSLNWRESGTTNYTPANFRIQAGCIVLAGNPQTVTFPVAFAGTPVVVITSDSAFKEWARLASVTASAITIQGMNDAGNATGFRVHWVAIGPTS